MSGHRMREQADMVRGPPSAASVMIASVRDLPSRKQAR
jgi:hypothetical protein